MKVDRIWLKNYPADVPADIAPLPYSSLGEMINTSFKTYSSRTAQVFVGKKFTYARLDQYSLRIASYLQSLGLSKGDHIALMMPNLPQYTVVAAAILRAGFVLVNVNPMYTPHELKHQLNDAQVKAIFIAENFAHTLTQVITETDIQHVIVTRIADLVGGIKGWAINKYVQLKGLIPAYDLPAAVTFKHALKQGRAHLHQFKMPDIHPDDIALLQYTGGTTGVSKGAVLSHRNLLSNLIQTYDWVSPAVKKLVAEESQIVFIGTLPFYHIFAFMINLLICFHIGGSAILITDPRNTTAMLRSMKKQPFHVFAGVSTLFNTILHHPLAKSIDWSFLRLSVAGGMSVQQATAQGWQKLTGCPMVEGYGMSETSPVICVTQVALGLEKGSERPLGIGYPVPSTEVVLLDENDKPVGLNTPGELCVRGPQVMAGYWNNPEETAKIMTKQGFLRTGDIAVMDEQGWFRIVDRKKDMILVSGFNVYPNEVEDAVTLMEGIKECVAVGVPNEKSGEAVAVIAVKQNPDITTEQVKAWCKQHLTAYKCPRYILFREELPKSAVGKVLRKELKPILDELLQNSAV